MRLRSTSSWIPWQRSSIQDSTMASGSDPSLTSTCSEHRMVSRAPLPPHCEPPPPRDALLTSASRNRLTASPVPTMASVAGVRLWSRVPAPDVRRLAATASSGRTRGPSPGARSRRSKPAWLSFFCHGTFDRTRHRLVLPILGGVERWILSQSTLDALDGAPSPSETGKPAAWSGARIITGRRHGMHLVARLVSLVDGVLQIVHGVFVQNKIQMKRAHRGL